MEKNTVTESPIVCNLTALNAGQRERHQANAQQLFAAVQEIRELPDGFAFRLPAESAMILKAAEFITLERLCCPFFTFGVQLEGENGPLWLKLTGQGEVKQFLQTEFSLDDRLKLAS